MNRLLAVVILACAPLACCQVTSDDLLGAENLEQFNGHAARARERGAEGIPLLLMSIEDSLRTPYSVFSYGKLNTSIQHLHDLAAEGIFTTESVPVLIRTIEEQIYIGDTIVTAETLRMITGLDVGYSEEFVSRYRVEDEERRREMISRWRRWHLSRSGSSAGE